MQEGYAIKKRKKMAKFRRRKRGGFRRKKRGLWPRVKRVIVVNRRGGSNL